MTEITRRKFLKQGATAGAAIAAPMIVPAKALGADGGIAANERIGVGLIGRGHMSRGHLNHMIRDPWVEVPAVCDVDAVRREEAKNTVDEKSAAERRSGIRRGCTAYNDYRELLARDDIDAVIITTPDHWHAPIAIDAARAGKDLYCEKPVALAIEEGRRLVETIQRYGRVFQTGMQRRSNPIFEKVCNFIRDGKLGKIKSVYTTLPLQRNYLGQGTFKPYRNGPLELEKLGEEVVAMDVPLPEEEMPEGLDWNLWVGPAPMRPYNHCYHTNEWETGTVPWCFCVDFGHGGLSNHTVHSFDLIQYALGVEASGPVEAIHPNSGEFPTVSYRYANGTTMHMLYLRTGRGDLPPYEPIPGKKQTAGMFGGLFVGERGWIDAFAGGPVEFDPPEIGEELGIEHGTPLEHDHRHREDWLECIRTRGRPITNEEDGHRAASVGHIGDVAWWVGRSVKWDPERERFIDDDDANRLLQRTTRPLPEMG